MAKPCELPLGIMTGVLLCFRSCGRERYLAGEMAYQPWYPVGLHGGQERIKPPRRQRPHLIERAGGQHGVETRPDSPVQPSAIGSAKNFTHARAADQRRRRGGPPIPYRS